MAFRFLAAALAIAAGATSAADPNWRAEIRGRVLDAATGQPVEGAVIVAAWETELPPNPLVVVPALVIGGHGPPSVLRTAQVKVALSGADGRFVVDGFAASEQLTLGPIWHAAAVSAFLAGYEPQGLREEEAALSRPFTDELRIYRYGTKPTYGRVRPSRISSERQTLENLHAFMRWLEFHVQYAADPSAPEDTRKRATVRAVQQPAMAMVSREIQRWIALYPELREPERFPLNELLATTPGFEAERAFRSGDRRQIVVPQCQGPGADATAGWPITCNDFEHEDPQMARRGRLAKYAEEYNRILFELVRMETQ